MVTQSAGSGAGGSAADSRPGDSLLRYLVAAQVEARFQTILDGAPDAIVGVDVQGSIRLVNAQTERLFGYQRQEILGEPLEILLSEDGKHVYRSKTFTDPATRRVRGGFDLEGRKSDGSTVPVNVTLSSVDTEAGQIILGAFRDVSERQRTEKALRAFVANAAHELRTPLTTISGLAAILAARRGQLTEEQLESSFAAIGRQGERARELITSLLDLSQLEHGSIKLDLDVLDLSEVTSRAICASPPSPPRTVTVESVDFQVRSDRVRLEQVFVNLLGNAYRYGGPNVRIAASHQGPFVLVVVSDDGPGVPSELIPRLFEPFARARHVEGIQGSGLGLAIVRRILEASGGEISYDRRSSTGARFLIRLPQAA